MVHFQHELTQNFIYHWLIFFWLREIAGWALNSNPTVEKFLRINDWKQLEWFQNSKLNVNAYYFHPNWYERVRCILNRNIDLNLSNQTANAQTLSFESSTLIPISTNRFFYFVYLWYLKITMIATTTWEHSRFHLIFRNSDKFLKKIVGKIVSWCGLSYYFLFLALI